MEAAKISYFEKNFRIVFQPKKINLIARSRRFYVGSGQLALYIGEKYAMQVQEKAEAMKTDKLRMKFKGLGIVDIYAI